MSYDLWAEASADHDAMAREAAMARAEAGFADLFPFLAMARTEGEFGHRLAIARDSLEAIAAVNGVAVEDVQELALRRWNLMREALAEGQDPLIPVTQATDGGYGSGPEKPLEHDEGPDFSGDYAEVPQGGPGGPNPQVTHPRPPMSGPVQEATGSLRRQADGGMMSPGYTQPMPPDTGTGRGSLDSGLPSGGGMTPSLPAGVNDAEANQPVTPPSIGQVTSSRDPVHRRVLTVTSAIADSNPHLPKAECERVARVVVGRYLRHADLTGSAMDDEPVNSGGGSGGDTGGGGKSPGFLQRGLEWKGLQSVLPGAGAAGEAGAAGGGEALLAAAAL